MLCHQVRGCRCVTLHTEEERWKDRVAQLSKQFEEGNSQPSRPCLCCCRSHVSCGSATCRARWIERQLENEHVVHSEEFRLGINRFNSGFHEEGLLFLEEAGMLLGGDRMCEDALVDLLSKSNKIGLSACQVAAFLCGSPERNHLLRLFVRQFDFMHRPLDEALREFFKYLALPLEARGVDSNVKKYSSWGTASFGSSRSVGSSPTSSRLRRRLSSGSISGASVKSFFRFSRNRSFNSFDHETTFSGDDRSWDGERSDSPSSPSGPTRRERHPEGFRVALKYFAEQFWNLNADTVGDVFVSSHLVFALVLQLASLFRLCHQVNQKFRRKGDKALYKAIQATKESEWQGFVDAVQDIAFSLAGKQLDESLLLGMFDRILSKPPSLQVPHISPRGLDRIGLASGSRSVLASPDCQGFLWMEVAAALSPSGKAFSPIPHVLRERVWFVLQDWVLYGFDGEPGYPESETLLFILPLDDIQPLLQFHSVQLVGTVKIACKFPPYQTQDTPRKPNRFIRLFPKTKSSPKGSPGSLLQFQDLKLRASTPQEAEHWYQVLTQSRKSARVDDSASFSKLISSKKRDKHVDSETDHSSSSPGRLDPDQELLEELTDDVSKKPLKGLLFVKLGEGAVKKKSKKKTPDASASAPSSAFLKSDIPEGKVPAGYQVKHCTLLGNNMYISDTVKRVDQSMVMDLDELRIAIPSTDSSALAVGAFPFELIRNDLKTMCICAAPSLKDYTLWFNAFTSKISSARAKGTDHSNTTSEPHPGRYFDDDQTTGSDDGTPSWSSPGSVYSFGSSAFENGPSGPGRLRIDTPNSLNSNWLQEESHSTYAPKRVDMLDGENASCANDDSFSETTIPCETFQGGYSFSPDTSTSPGILQEVSSPHTEPHTEPVPSPPKLPPPAPPPPVPPPKAPPL